MQDYDRQYSPEPRSAVVRRRLITVPRTFLLLLAAAITFPLALAVGAGIDVTRRVVSGKPAMTLRLAVFGLVFLSAEVVGIIWMFAMWLASGFGGNRKLLAESTWPIQRWWARTLFRAVERVFSLHFEVSGFEEASPGPLIVMSRHASIIDNLLPAVFLTSGQALKLRWVIKKELLTLPSIDIAGRRLPNYFVDREAADPRSELDHIEMLARDLDTDEGVLMFPEGTRFTIEKLARARERLAGGDPELDTMALRMRHVLPPRVGGPSLLLASGNDVLVVAHVGLGGFADLKEIWSGALVGRTVRISARRYPSTDIPADQNARIRWLYQRWLEVDEWIYQQRATHRMS